MCVSREVGCASRDVRAVPDLLRTPSRRPTTDLQDSTMPTRIVVVMDPIATIKPAKDTTLAMMLAAQHRNWELWYAEQRDLWLNDGVAFARLRPVRVRDDLKSWFELGEPVTARLAEYDAIL